MTTDKSDEDCVLDSSLKTAITPHSPKGRELNSEVERRREITIPQQSARSVFVAWEKLRLIFNAILSGVFLLFLASTFRLPELGNPVFWIYFAPWMFVANVYFCLGSWLEGWLCIAGADRNAVRLILFVLGLSIACFLAIAALRFNSFAMPQAP